MIRSAAIQVGQIIKQNFTEFNDGNLFILKPIFETILQQKRFPIVRIDSLATSNNDYVSNKKRTELISCQINVFVSTNKDLDNYFQRLEQVLSTHGFECFFSTSQYVEDYQVQQLIMRVQTTQFLKED